MAMKKVFTISLMLIATHFAIEVYGAMDNQSNVVINEIAWMGSAASASDEWIELKNTTNESINLSGWTLQSVDGNINIGLAGIIGPQGLYLLERTDNNSVPEIEAGAIYKGVLNNTGGHLQLYDSENNSIDQVNFSSTWPAGNAATHQTMEKINGTWYTSQKAGGTPGKQNSFGVAVAVTAPTPKVISGIIINEVLPNPKTADQTDEWIELYNTNDVSVAISGWKLQDTGGASTTYTIPKNTFMAAHGYVVLKRPVTKITLNNDVDGLRLLSPSGTVVDTMEYTKTVTDQSYNKTPLDWQWSATPTPGKTNNISMPDGEAYDLNNQTAALSKIKKTDTYGSALSKSKNATSHPMWLFIIALAITLVCATTILLLKFKMLKK